MLKRLRPEGPPGPPAGASVDEHINARPRVSTGARAHSSLLPAGPRRNPRPLASAFVLAMVLLNGHIGTEAADLKLLPPEQAFRFSARALDTRTLEANFTVAPGYYMYRDKMSFVLEPEEPALEQAVLPPGKIKEDEFFGRVQTYRDRVVVRLPMVKAAPGKTLTLRAESQGCADAGVCYPPNAQRVTLSVPAVDGKAGALVEAPAGKRWFQ